MESGTPGTEWRSIDEGADIVFIEDPPHPIVLRGILAVDEPRRGRRALAIGPVVASLYRALSLSLSAFAHVMAAVVLVGLVLATVPPEREPVVAISLAPSGESAERQDQGRDGADHEPPPVLPQPAPDDPPTPEPSKVEKPTPEPPKPAPAVEKPDVIAAPDASGERAGGKPVTGAPIFSGRGGAGRGAALRKYGGTEASESAVELGLRWLALHEADGGGWSAAFFTTRCPTRDACLDSDARGDPVYNAGVTATALLAFLGAGYRPDGGDYADVVRRGLAYLVKIQRADGGITSQGATNLYNHAIATWALAEAAAITGDEGWRTAAQKGVDFLAEDQREGGGWDYFQRAAPDKERNDASITGWAILALKSAQIAKLKVPDYVLTRAKKFLDDRTDRRTGELTYADYAPGQGLKGDGLVAVGLLCRLYLGMKDKEPMSAAAARLMRNLPDWKAFEEAQERGLRFARLEQDHNMYYWYYGTLACFQLGGEEWTRWNGKMRDMLIAHQERREHRAGSWAPEHSYIGRTGGRVWATAVSVLNLEVYYRYLPLYALSNAPVEPAPLPKAELLDRLKKARTQGETLEAMTGLARFKDEADAIGAIAAKLADEDSMIRWNASKHLADMRAVAALPALMRAAERETTPVKGAMLEHLARFGDAKVAPILIAALADANERVAAGARAALKQLSGEDHGSDAAAWRAWYERQR